METRNNLQQAEAIIRQRGGILRTSEALRLGIHPRTLYRLHELGRLERLERGLYRLTGTPPFAYPDFVIVARKVPRGVICLTSALAFHGLTTQVPHAVDLALPAGARRPRLHHPPLQVYRFSFPTFEAGIEVHEDGGVPFRLYNPAKSVADAFKFRHRIGTDIATEALRNYLRSGRPLDTLMDYARLCRVAEVLRPYIEALT